MEIELTGRQWEFVRAKADEVLFGGAAGGGKSYAQVADVLLYAMRYPGSRQLLMRRTYPELEKSLLRQMLSLYPATLFTYKKSEKCGVFANGSVVDLGYCDKESDVYKYQSAEYDVIRFDELTHFTEQMYVYLISRLRGVSGYPKQVKSSTNPGGIGHGWVKSRFIDIGEPDKEYSFTAGGRIFLPAKVTDNRFLMEKDPAYLRRLENLSEKDKKALLYGQWDLFEGQFFDMWDREKHIVSPFAIPADWRRYFVMDYGLDMLAGFLVAVDPFGSAYVYRELYEGKDNGGQGHIVSSAAARIKEFCGEERIYTFLAPPDLWSRQKDSGRALADLFYEGGVRLTRAPNGRVAGWMQLKEWLRPSEREDGRILPRLRIFSNCVNLIRTLPALICDPDNPSDCMSHPHELTHAPDALRYFAAACPKAALVKKAPPHYNFACERPKRDGLKGRIRIMEKVKYFIAALLGVLVCYGQKYALLYAFVGGAVLMDLISGMAAAVIAGGGLSSAVARKGIYKKLMLLFAVGFGTFLDVFIPYAAGAVGLRLETGLLFSAVISVYIAVGECISIAENIFKATGKPLPEAVTKILSELQKK